MKQLSAPYLFFDNDPPAYKEIMKIMLKMKSSGSPCPLGRVSMIVLKRNIHLENNGILLEK